MTETSVAVGSQLSEGFRRARTLSRILAFILSLGFWLTVVLGLVVVGGIIFGALLWPVIWQLPDHAVLSYNNSPEVRISSLSLGGKLGVIAAVLLRFGPAAVALRFGHRVLLHLAKGEVFSTDTIASMRTVSLWMVGVAFATSVDKFVFNVSTGLGPHGLTANLSLLFFGLCAYVAAYVMSEARRIADDNASIV
jgi:hypothetical protein